MLITIEENRESIKRYSHVKPASSKDGAPCSARCPGSTRTCTLKRGHAGPHISHQGLFRKVVAVWDKGLKLQDVDQKAIQRVVAQARPPAGRWRSLWKSVRGTLVPRPQVVETVIFLLLALSMVGFAIDWALRIAGLK
jgi:hypothetical protein